MVANMFLIVLILLIDRSSYVGGHSFEGNTPYFKSLVESGSRIRFESQFRRSEPAQDGNNEENTVEQTVAERIMRDIDTSGNPCENFFNFACGGYIRENDRPGGVISSFTRPDNVINRIVNRELQTIILKSDPMPLQKAKQMFQSCMDEESIERRGIQPVLQFLSDRGGWPVLGYNWDEIRFNYIDMLAKTRPLQKDYEFHYQPSGTIIGMIIQRDFGDKSKYAIYIDQPSLGQFSFIGLPNHEVYRLGKNSIYNKAYEEYLTDIAVTLGADVRIARRDMREVVNFETELAKIMLFEEERRLVEYRYNKISVLELSLRYPKIDFLRYLQKVLSVANINVDLSTKIVLWAAPYYDKLSQIIERTSRRTLANYILLRAIQPLLPTLSKNIQYLTLRYIAVVNGAYDPQLGERSEVCTGVVRSQMDLVTSRIFIDKMSINRTIIRHSYEISAYVKSTMADMILNAKWLSKQTKPLALKKLNSIRDKIGFPEEILQNEFLAKFYERFRIGKYLFENMKNVLVDNYRNIVFKLIDAPKDEWILRPGTVGALHNLGTTSIEIPLGTLADPFIELDYPPSMGFGGIGFLIGHEYAHGFEVTGIKFDWNSVIRKYWSELSFRNFANRADCYVHQYSRYFFPDANLLIRNGNKTLNENLCDNIGITSAFYAYKKWKRERRIHDNVAGLPYTGDQLFFINMARTWCTNTSPVFLRKFPLLDHHSLNQLRVIAVLQNAPEFSSSFGCPIGSFMNPPKKCRFW